MKIGKALKHVCIKLDSSLGWSQGRKWPRWRTWFSSRENSASSDLRLAGRAGYLWRPPSAEIIRPTDAEITTEYESLRFTNGPLRLQLAARRTRLGRNERARLPAWLRERFRKLDLATANGIQCAARFHRLGVSRAAKRGTLNLRIVDSTFLRKKRRICATTRALYFAINAIRGTVTRDLTNSTKERCRPKYYR